MKHIKHNISFHFKSLAKIHVWNINTNQYKVRIKLLKSINILENHSLSKFPFSECPTLPYNVSVLLAFLFVKSQINHPFLLSSYFIILILSWISHSLNSYNIASFCLTKFKVFARHETWNPPIDLVMNPRISLIFHTII